MRVAIALFWSMLFHVGFGLICHLKECSDVNSCAIGWDICEGTYCYMLRLQNVTNSQHFLLRRGCFGSDPPQIRYNNELKPFSSLNECRKIVWKGIEYLVNICADADYCNVCNYWGESMPEKAAAARGRRRGTGDGGVGPFATALLLLMPLATLLYNALT